MFKPVPNRVDYVNLEHEVQAWWDAHDIPRKYRERNQDANERWSFIDGPITANNPMGVHHAWGRSYKDLYNRFWTMRGKKLRYQNGFDCQGLWIEVEVEKELGFKSKRDIEAFGVAEFVEACKERVRRFAAIQTQQSIRMAYWMDWDNSYFTNSDENNYTIWQFLKKIWERGWLYKGHDTMPWCPRCGTGISQHEIVTEGYQEITHRSVYLRFPLVDNDDVSQPHLTDLEQQNVGASGHASLLVWTTTPWTLPANVAAAVHPELDYELVKQGDDLFYVSKGARATAVRGEHEVVGEVKGSQLVGRYFRSPFQELPAQEGVTHQIIPWNDVSDAEGTGIVHIAPGAGAEDFALSKEYDLAVIAPLAEDGTYLDNGQFGPFTGLFAGDVPQMVFDSLKDKGILHRVQDYTHRYPTCWRCSSELVFRLVDEWFINMDGEIAGTNMSLRDKIIEASQGANWIPEFGKARELDWLRNMHDWMISKKRYYGLALPIYECAACGTVEVIGSETELEARAQSGWDEFEGHSPHRPWVDAVKIACHKCGETVERIKDVGNPWLDAGIVPFSTLGSRNNPDYWREWFPADWVSESFPGQFRNWFYSLLAMGTVMTLDTEFDATSPFKTLFSYALLRDENGEEMHKSKGNAIWFEDAAEKMGVDAMRWMYMRTPPASNLNFGYGAGDEIKRGFFSTLWNTYSFFITYASIDEWTPYKDAGRAPTGLTELDHWALSELNQLVQSVTTALEGYDAMAAARQVEAFVEGLSNWYVRRSRRRFWKSESDLDKEAAYYTLWTCLTTVNRLMAPFTPFVAEEMYQNLVRGADATAAESVHLNPWPVADESLIDMALNESVNDLQRIVSLGRAARAKANLKIRQPLQRIVIRLPVATGDLTARVQLMAHELEEELNVKEVWLMLTGLGEDGAGYVPGQTRTTGEPIMDIDILEFQVRANLPVLGQKLGPQMGRFQQAFGKADKLKLARRRLAGLWTMLDGFDIQADELLVTTTGASGYVVAEDAGYVVAISTEVTMELRREGIARELVRHSQERRKQKGFEITDRVNLVFATDSQLVREAIKEWATYVTAETLAVSLETIPAAEVEALRVQKPAFYEQGDITVEVDGYDVAIYVERVRT